MTDIEQLDELLCQEHLEILEEKALTRYLDSVEKVREDYIKVFGEIESNVMQICVKSWNVWKNIRMLPKPETEAL